MTKCHKCLIKYNSFCMPYRVLLLVLKQPSCSKSVSFAWQILFCTRLVLALDCKPRPFGLKHCMHIEVPSHRRKSNTLFFLFFEISVKMVHSLRLVRTTAFKFNIVMQSHIIHWNMLSRVYAVCWPLVPAHGFCPILIH